MKHNRIRKNLADNGVPMRYSIIFFVKILDIQGE